MKKILILLLGVSNAFLLKSQIAMDLQKHVDLSTGDFNYGIPLMNVSGPNGENFPINISYRAGVQVEQDASWVGLGWNLSLGEITRQINGVPDDWNSREFQQKVTGQTTKNFEYYGPIHFSDLPTSMDYTSTDVRMDVFASKRGMNYGSGAYEGPDYDKYYVSGPGIGGEMRPYLFDYASLFEKSETGYFYGDPSSSSYQHFTKKAQFRFKGDGLPNVTLPYYDQNSPANILTNLEYSGTDYSWSGYTTEWDDALRKPWDNVFSTHQFGGDYDPNISDEKQRSSVSKCVEYFSNQQIYNHYASSAIDGFLDFDAFTAGTCDRDDDDYYDEEGIGAFRITMPNGMVYHYSLPVYTHTKVSREFSGYEQGYSAGDGRVDYVLNHRYANSWKLTAITGPDFVDNAPTGVVDENDEGYWVKINYKKWNKQDYPYERNYPFFGFEENASYKEVPGEYSFNKRYDGSKGTVQVITEDIYYPHSIETATQTAFFIKEIRDDAHSNNTVDGIMPLLRLKNIVLLDNDDVDNYFQSLSTLTNTDFPAMGTLTRNSDVLHSGDYATAQLNSNTHDIDEVTLRSVAFNYDYSLTRKLPNNIENTISNLSNQSISGAVIFQTATVSSPVNTDLGGKLTLKEIELNGYENQPIYSSTEPAFSFEYLSGDKNPDYSVIYKDFFGFYRRYNTSNDPGNTDIDSKDHLSDYSKDYVDAWSLKSITTPLGGEIEVSYEADRYLGSFYHYNHKESGFAAKLLRANFSTSGYNIESTAALDSAWGGGLRVKQLKLIEPDLNQEYVLAFDYTTGYIGTEPNKYYVEVTHGDPQYTKHISDRFAAPSVVRYGKVHVKPLGDANLNGTDNETQIGKIEYTFDNTSDYFRTKHLKGIKKNGSHVYVKEFVSVSNTNLGGGGRILKIRTLDRSGGVLKTVRYRYSDQALGQGSVKEMFYKYFNITNSLATGSYGTVTIDRVFIREERNTVLAGVYTEEGDAVNAVHHTAFDKYTRVPKATTIVENAGSPEEHSYNLTKSFAYETNAGMGPKHANSSNQNLLTASHESKHGQLPTDESSNSWTKVNERRGIDPSGTYQDVYTFETESDGQWYPAKSFRSDGTATVANWERTQHGTLFNENNRLIEGKDLSGKFWATTYAGKRQLPVSSAVASNYSSYFHTSFEYTTTKNGYSFFDSEVLKGTLQNDGGETIEPHTGDYMAIITKSQTYGPVYQTKRITESVNGEMVEQGILPGRNYEASVWVHNNSPEAVSLICKVIGEDGNSNTVNQTYSRTLSHAENITVGNWTLIKVQFPVPEGFTTSKTSDKVNVAVWNTSGTGDAYIDDLRLQPVDATVTATVYDKKRQLPTYVIDNENFYTRFVYDAAGRVIETHRETEGGEIQIQESVNHFAQ